MKVVAFDEIRNNLPADHPTVTAEDRAAIWHDRYMTVNKRRNPTGQFDSVQAESSGGSSGCAVGGTSSQGVSLALGALALLAVRKRRR
ncbi:MAG: MYXO-CTERM sorting domain-containing protein [Polyangiales bacterium]